jgi:hypothetical protein
VTLVAILAVPGNRRRNGCCDRHPAAVRGPIATGRDRFDGLFSTCTH